MTDREQQITDIKRKIAARENAPGYEDNVRDLRKRLAELEAGEAR